MVRFELWHDSVILQPISLVRHHFLQSYFDKTAQAQWKLWQCALFHDQDFQWQPIQWSRISMIINAKEFSGASSIASPSILAPLYYHRIISQPYECRAAPSLHLFILLITGNKFNVKPILWGIVLYRVFNSSSISVFVFALWGNKNGNVKMRAGWFS